MRQWKWDFSHHAAAIAGGWKQKEREAEKNSQLIKEEEEEKDHIADLLLVSGEYLDLNCWKMTISHSMLTCQLIPCVFLSFLLCFVPVLLLLLLLAWHFGLI